MIQRKLLLAYVLLQVVNASLKNDHPQSSKFIILLKVMHVKYRQITKKERLLLDELFQAELMGISVFFNTLFKL